MSMPVGGALDHGQGWLRDYDRVAAAIEWLDAHRTAQPRVEEVAAALHLSSGHLHRTFVRFAGVSPHRFLQWLTLGAAKVLLRERSTVLEVAAATGLSSPGRLYDLTVALEAITPGDLGRGGAGLTIHYGVHATPLGAALVAVTDRGVLSLRFLDPPRTEAEAIEAVQREWPNARLSEDAGATAPVVEHIAARFAAAGVPGGGAAGDGAAAAPRPLTVLAGGTNLQVRVWDALLRIPEDRVVSYSEVARAAGRPGAARAVANAVGRNPVAVLVPCHRVLRSTGELGGYRWGATRKRALLAREAVHAVHG